ncbi:MAG: Asp-tRNA(Asn)/Glu-tRNA(Gln) amidotransferase subunit GatC [bacterium]
MAKNILSKEEVLHLAKLAGLTLSDIEIEKNSLQLGETIDYIKNLDELNTDGILPTNSVVDLSNVTFEDGTQNKRALSQKEATANGKNVHKNAFAVDRMM